MTTDPTQAAMETARKLLGPFACKEMTCPDFIFGKKGCCCHNEARAIVRALILAKVEEARETADWLESNGQPGYAIKLRAHALELEQAAERITP